MTRLRPVAMVALAACSSSYRPRPDPTIATILSGGGPAYVRCGHEYPHGLAGGGLVDAVRDDPAAEAHAETAHGRNIGSVVLMFGGLALFGGAIATDAGRDAGEHPSAVTNGLTGAAFVALLAALPLAVSAVAHQTDAINLYNDDARARGATCAEGRP